MRDNNYNNIIIVSGMPSNYVLFPIIVSSAPPTSVNVSDVTSSSVIVHWGPVQCIHRNGDITGYSIKYGVNGSGSTQTMTVSAVSMTEVIISGVQFSTTYFIEVAAVNSAGTGVYSSPTQVIVSEGKKSSHRKISLRYCYGLLQHSNSA